MKLGIIGCGKMGRALAVGAIDAGAVAGLAELEAAGLRAACLDAVTAATERARELGGR